MRNYFIAKALYWSAGVITGCLIILSYRKHCDKSNEVTGNRPRWMAGGDHEYRDTIASNENMKFDSLFPEPYKVYKSLDKHKRDINFDGRPAKLLAGGGTPTKLGDSEWLNCDEIYRVLEMVKAKEAGQYRKENKDGNKAVYFTTVLNQTGHHIRAVVKHATLKNSSSESEVYRYHSAQKEIDNLRTLKSLGWKGIPDLLGACVYPSNVTYIVTQIIGKPLCSGEGTDQACAIAYDFRKFIEQSPDPGYSTVLWLSKAFCFFKQFEEHRVFMEDFSGVNFYFSPETLDLFIVDADSLLFYGDVRIYSRSSCREHMDCSRPGGNLWRQSALNHKIYYSCREVEGYCDNNTCRGYDAKLHTCGVGRWLISPLRNCIPLDLYKDFIRLTHCVMEALPQDRCSLSDCCNEATLMLEKLKNSNPH